jgi:U3 small nucleolar RNA-associated protein 19
MPYLEPSETTHRRRKRKDDKNTPSKPVKSRTDLKSHDESTASTQDILDLEGSISESSKNYNNITKLLSIAKARNGNKEVTTLGLVALCRVFCRLQVSGSLDSVKTASQSNIIIVKWLNERKNEFVQLLGTLVSDEEQELKSTVLELWMRLVKEEVNRKAVTWKTGLFSKLMHLLVSHYESSESSRDEFIQKYFTKFRDVQYHTLGLIMSEIRGSSSSSDKEVMVSSSLDILFELPDPSSFENDEPKFFAGRSEGEKTSLLQINAFKKRTEEAWLSVLGTDLKEEQRKAILSNLVHGVIVWFNNVERLADFLTDSYNFGGSTSLLALSGVYHLISERNLDYPSFYAKLYSLLDESILHSKHRSRFFRLLDIFMSSTHLPAALVASFIKRLSRLALHASPAGIVAVVPWIYNMFKKHPQCTFMIHREMRTEEEKQEIDTYGFEDPFDMDEPDPMKTCAIDSSIWEIETLQSHYHPNVATLAKVVSEQFTKQSYNMEDFLDHSYNTLIDSELRKDMKKAPVVEYQIPKRIFIESETKLNELGILMTKVMESS